MNERLKGLDLRKCLEVKIENELFALLSNFKSLGLFTSVKQQVRFKGELKVERPDIVAYGRDGRICFIVEVKWRKKSPDSNLKRGVL